MSSFASLSPRSRLVLPATRTMLAWYAPSDEPSSDADSPPPRPPLLLRTDTAGPTDPEEGTARVCETNAWWIQARRRQNLRQILRN